MRQNLLACDEYEHAGSEGDSRKDGYELPEMEPGVTGSCLSSGLKGNSSSSSIYSWTP